MADQTENIFTVKAAVTLLFCAAYIGVMVWAVVHDKLDLSSYISGVGPSVGVLLKGWFDSKG